ncbi:hypothetical protein [Limnospira fusiformis]|uniref:hypothetical protein n=1 Tax=Limnospira fusiformis TaxID=54297 RepID=UPI0014499A7A|nr:hypothetical protein HFV01_07930 [Limnospira fusiformis SAG 85.79]QNH56206.1 MAG: hypothetical protein H2674_17890 [Limnospira indica BM01]
MVFFVVARHFFLIIPRALLSRVLPRMVLLHQCLEAIATFYSHYSDPLLPSAIAC